MLYKVAICDDEEKEIRIIGDYLIQFSMKTDIEFIIKRFSGGEDLLKCYEGNQGIFDIIFLDVEMKELNGIQTAEKIRSIPDRNALIAYITSYPEYMQDSFDVQASQYLIKPLSYEMFEEKLQRMIGYLKELETNITVISLKSGDVILHLEDIVCFETEKGSKIKSNLIVTTLSEELMIKGKITDFEKELKDKYFISVHRSVLANMKYVKRFNKNTAVFTTGKEVELSRRKIPYIKEAFSKYMIMRYRK